jgi:hypothetical protein
VTPRHTPPPPVRTHGRPGYPLIACLSSVCLLASCMYAQQPADTAGVVAIPSVERIVDHPDQWYEESVTVVARIGTALDEGAFTLRKRGLFGTGRGLLVLVPAGNPGYRAGSWVTVTGTVRRFVEADLRSDYAFAWTWEPQSLRDFQSGPVLIADRVLLAEPLP